MCQRLHPSHGDLGTSWKGLWTKKLCKKPQKPHPWNDNTHCHRHLVPLRLLCALNWNIVFVLLRLAAWRQCQALWKSSLQTPLSCLCSPCAPCPVCLVYFPLSATDEALPFWEPKSHPLWLSPLGHKYSWAAGICFVNRQLKWRREKKSLLTLHSQSPKTAVLRGSILHIMRRFWKVLSTLISKELNWRQG